MKSGFIAIGVAQGDAFVIKRSDGFVALIDGGRSAAGFCAQFQRVTGLNSVDVVVCTHNDADHANGIIGLLQSGLPCKEVWLPASWTDRLRDLLDPAKFAGELAYDVSKVKHEEIAEAGDLNTFFENHAERLEATDRESSKKEISTEELAESILETDSGDSIEPHHYPWICRNSEQWFNMRNLLADPTRYRLFVEAIAAGERIRQIAQLAFHNGSRIRWFEYSDSQASGGIQGKLVPVNAREVLKVKVNNLEYLNYFALTIANRQSLVFCSPGDSVSPAALFTGDSDLSFSNSVPWSDGMMITAPHHGSENNLKAYQRFQREMKNPASTAWVRSDGRFKSRPGQWFLDLRRDNVPVFCTLCRGALSTKQDLVFTEGGQSWNPLNTQSCSCT